mmetsp:Transcript_27440/g.60021  ORF Transcript_27440/g.60021 Transcript_27440/m.60021 type:complete len:324 (-) Transcript_27440:770-1741(-)
MAHPQMLDFLKSETLSHFISEHQQALAALTTSATIADAFKVLHEKHILSVPVTDQKGEYVGAVSVNDIIRALHVSMEANFGPHYAEEVASLQQEEAADKALTTVGEYFSSKTVESLVHVADMWMKGDTATTLLSVILNGFHVKGKVHHRIFVCEQAGASTWHPSHVVSQSDIVTLLWQHRDKLGADASKTVEELGLTSGAVFCIEKSAPALTAFHHMAVDHKSSVGVVDAAGKLIGNLSASDIRELPPTQFGLLLKSVEEFEVAVNGKFRPAVSVTAGTTFVQLLEALVSQKLHRVYVVDTENKPVSIITLTDVLKEVVKGAQ